MNSAVISADKRYRYELARDVTDITPVKPLVWVMLNPSTADAAHDDPTIRRVIDFTARFGFTQAIVVNLYAYRATRPRQLWCVPDPVGDKNDAYVYRALKRADAAVLAWGSDAGPNAGRPAVILALAKRARTACYALGYAANGEPRHPLMMPKDSRLEPYPKKVRS